MTSEIQLESATSAGQLQEHEEAVQKAKTPKQGTGRCKGVCLPPEKRNLKG